MRSAGGRTKLLVEFLERCTSEKIVYRPYTVFKYNRVHANPGTVLFLTMQMTDAKESKSDSKKSGKRAPKPPSGSLTEASITAAALLLIDSEGLERFSLRNLASSLGVYPAAVYWYLPSKDVVAAAVMSLVLREVAPDVHPADWKGYLRSLMRRCRRAIQQHPNTAPLLGAQLTANTRVDLGLIEGILQALSSAGFEEKRLVDAYNATIATLVGFATQEFSPMPESGEDWQTLTRERLDAIDPDKFPTLGQHLPLLKNKSFILRWDNGVGVPLDESFDFYVEAFIAGLEQLAK
jgi:AcrR family transcriptional regulator